MAADQDAPIEPGAVYELTGELAIDSGEHELPRGAVVAVVDVVERGTPGVGDSETRTVIFAYRYYDLPTRTAEGAWAYLEHVRHVAIALPDFRRHFAPTDKDPTPTRPEV